MTASSRTRTRAPWIAIGLALATALAPLSPAFGEEPPPETPAAESIPADTVAEQETTEPDPATPEEVDPTATPEPTEEPPAPEASDEVEAPEADAPTVPERRTRASFSPADAAVHGISVSPSTGLEVGDTVTVSGSYPSTVTTTGGELPPVLYLWFCSQPEGSTVGTADGRATNTGRTDCAGSAQFVAPVAVPSAGVPSGTGTVSDGVWTFEKEFTIPADAIDGETCLDADAEGIQCSIFTRLNHQFTEGNTASPFVFDQYAHVTFTAPTGPGGPGDDDDDDETGGPGSGGPGTGSPGPQLSATPSRISVTGATTVTIRGTGYTGPGAANGVYVNIGDAGVWRPGQVPSEGGWVVSTWVPSLSAGSFTTTLTVPAGSFEPGDRPGVATFAAHALALTNRSLDAWLPLSIGGSGNTSGPQGLAEPAATPPSEEGLALETSSATEGGFVTVTGEGFEPNEEDILVVLYSDPIVLDSDARADGDGVVSWTGRLPAGVTGSHTLTLQGSISVGTPIEIAPSAVVGCEIDDSSLVWGFKESFRAYIDGSIANGEWTADNGASYATPDFSWADGAGSFEPEPSSGTVSFTGSVRFTGHNGALDTTVANPRIEFTAQGGTLLLDVSGTTQDGRELSKVGVEFATLDLAGATVTVDDGVLLVADAPAVLTADGAEVFGTYPEGEALDPVTFELTSADCADGATEPVASEGPVDEGFPAWLVWLILALVLVAIIVTVVVILRRRAAA